MNPPLHPLAELQSLLLDLISPARPVDQARLDALGEPQWQNILRMARQHRLGPLLHWQLGRAHAHLQCPESVKAQLLASYRQSALRNLMLQRELLLVHGILHDAGIPYVALKGAFLAVHAYPQPALRPMRDLDILVSEDQVLQAFQVLLDGGLTRNKSYEGSPEAWAQLYKHLPPLRSPSGSLNVELHRRVFRPDKDHGAAAELSLDPGFWQRALALPLGQASIRYEPPTDLLLHLIVHAAYDHEFDNGPLLLSDLAFLLDRHPIDWPLFWSMAERGGHSRGCWLALKLTERYWGEQPIAWPDNPALPDLEEGGLLARAAQLMLRDFDARENVSLHATMDAKPTLAAKAAHVCSRLFAPRTLVAAQYAVRPDDWRIYGYYPVRWWRLLSQRLPGFLHASKADGLQGEVLEIRALRHWLRQEEPHSVSSRPSPGP